MVKIKSVDIKEKEKAIFHLKKLFEEKRISIPKDKQLLDELVAVKIKKNGRIDMSTVSPAVGALALACWGAKDDKS